MIAITRNILRHNMPHFVDWLSKLSGVLRVRRAESTEVNSEKCWNKIVFFADRLPFWPPNQPRESVQIFLMLL